MRPHYFRSADARMRTQNALRLLFTSLRASSLFGGYREKWTRERHARGLGISRLASLVQIEELARRLIVY